MISDELADNLYNEVLRRLRANDLLWVALQIENQVLEGFLEEKVPEPLFSRSGVQSADDSRSPDQPFSKLKVSKTEKLSFHRELAAKEKLAVVADALERLTIDLDSTEQDGLSSLASFELSEVTFVEIDTDRSFALGKRTHNIEFAAKIVAFLRSGEIEEE